MLIRQSSGIRLYPGTSTNQLIDLVQLIETLEVPTPLNVTMYTGTVLLYTSLDIFCAKPLFCGGQVWRFSHQVLSIRPSKCTFEFHTALG